MSTPKSSTEVSPPAPNPRDNFLRRMRCTSWLLTIQISSAVSPCAFGPCVQKESSCHTLEIGENNLPASVATGNLSAKSLLDIKGKPAYCSSSPWSSQRKQKTSFSCSNRQLTKTTIFWKVSRIVLGGQKPELER